jgi:TPP-dependent indolepyruvate ferredoxin oxidoreductase alpha subunit
MVEPSDSAECKEFAIKAYDLSEKFDCPVILRLSTRVSHSQSAVELCDRVETVKIFPESVFNWHRWEGSINMHPSRIDRASHWRLVQEYMCLNLKHDWAKAQQQKMVKQEAQYCIDHCTPTDLGFLSIEDECV